MLDSISMEIIRVTENYNSRDYAEHNLMIRTVADIVADLKIPTTIVHIYDYSGDLTTVSHLIRSVCDNYKPFTGDCLAICATAFVGVGEMDGTVCYSAKNKCRGHIIGNRNLEPFKSLLAEKSTMLEELGFIDINGLIGYENLVPFIYANDVGELVVDYMKNFERVRIC